MRGRVLPQVLFCASAVIFGVCAVLQFTIGGVALGLLFSLIAVAGLALFVLIRSGRITW